MRKLVIAAVLFVAFPVFAQEKQNSFFVFVSNPQYEWTSNHGSDFNAGFGLALQHMFTSRWSGEVAVSHRSSRGTAYFYDLHGNIIDTIKFHSKITPVDLVAQYHWANGTAWKPYAGGGYTHVFVSADNARRTHADFFTLNGGVVWLVRPAWGLRVDGRVLFGGKPSYIDSSNVSFGVAWRF